MHNILFNIIYIIRNESCKSKIEMSGFSKVKMSALDSHLLLILADIHM